MCRTSIVIHNNHSLIWIYLFASYADAVLPHWLSPQSALGSLYRMPPSWKRIDVVFRFCLERCAYCPVRRACRHCTIHKRKGTDLVHACTCSEIGIPLMNLSCVHKAPSCRNCKASKCTCDNQQKLAPILSFEAVLENTIQ